MIAVVFALPDESRDIRAALGAIRGEGGNWHATVGGETVLIAHCGVGPERAARALAALLAEQRPRMLIATGFAGALDPALKIGALVLAANFSEPALLARADKTNARIGILTSAATPVESPADKQALATATGAIAVDMETAAIAAACAGAGVPLLSVRAISDLASEPLPVPFSQCFDLARQRPRPLALIWFLFCHPQRVGAFARFVRGLILARRALAEFLVEFIARSADEASTP